MIRNYFTTALRNLKKNPVFTAINVVGLSLGMAAFILIFQYVSFEKSVNKFHTNLPNLYRVLYEVSFQGKTNTWTSLPPALAPLAKDKFEEVIDYCRVLDGAGNGIVISESGKKSEKSFRENKVVYADGSFFKLFTFKILEGKSESLFQPNTVSISKSISEKYFGKNNALGKTLVFNNEFGSGLYTVTSIFENAPANSDLDYNFILSLQTLANPANLNGSDWARLDNFDAQFIETYLLTGENANYLALESKLNEAIKKANSDQQEIARLQPMANIHLPESLSDYYTTSGNLSFLYILEGIAIMILVIAWFNYVNLSTASALKRAKEVGIRKVIGATRKQLAVQFLGESLLLNSIGLLVALAIVNLVQGTYNQLVHQELSLSIFKQNWLWLGGFLTILIGAFATGSYSAFALSSFNPSQTLKGVFSKSAKGILMRKTLVVFQFSISVLLIASTIILYRQLDYMQNKDLGVSLNQLMTMMEPEVGRDSTFKQRSRAFLNDLSQQSFIQDYSMSGSVPGTFYNYNTSGYTGKNPSPGDEEINYSITFIDDHYLNLFGISISAGKNFTAEMCSKRFSANDKVMINESAASLLGFASPLEAVGEKVSNAAEVKKFGGDLVEYEIVGVIKDYHHLSLRKSIDPILFFPAYNAHYFTVNLNTLDIKNNIERLEELYKKNFPGNPFEFFFVDERYNQQYESEQQYGTVFSLASGLAIFIACLGLFGLATFTVEQRKKEIGIRKVLGANVSQITNLFSFDFLRLVFIAILIATPVSWYAMEKWLQDFAYHTDIQWWIFGIAGGMAVLIALVTVSSQAVKAALNNPVDSLRSE
ncbi:MAG: FtsX-like permease family protein [Cyclobacteriaceae bacterium]|nr:FtsX-like permease family protein [Cyclobacteriaceae bacterium]